MIKGSNVLGPSIKIVLHMQSENICTTIHTIPWNSDYCVYFRHRKSPIAPALPIDAGGARLQFSPVCAANNNTLIAEPPS